MYSHSHKLLLVTALCAATACSRGRSPEVQVVEETYVHKYGIDIPPEDWKSRGENGQVVSTLNNGVVVAKTYADGRVHGDTTFTFPYSAQIHRVEAYVNNQMVKETINYPSGAPMQQVSQTAEGGKLISMWYENGAPMSVEEYDLKDLLEHGEYYNLNHSIDSRVDDYEGIRTLHDRYGTLSSRETVQAGEVTEQVTYYPNGAPKTVTPYIHAIVSGVCKHFLQGGEPRSIEEWTDGKQHGLTTLFENGERVSEILYVNGEKNGVEHRYRNGNELVQEITWVEGKRHGPCKTCLGKVPQIEWYFRGEPVTKGNFDVLSRSYINTSL